MSSPSPDRWLCPNCDRLVPVGRSCSCLKKKTKARKKHRVKKSWEQDEGLDGLDLPDDSFDYDEFVAKEFGRGKPHKQIPIAFLWWITALGLLLIWLLFFVF